MIHSITLDAAWPEMTGRNMQRVAKREPDMLSRRFRLTGRGPLVSPARQGESVFLDSIFLDSMARVSRRCRNARVLDRSSAHAVAASQPCANQRYRLAVSGRWIPAVLPDQLGPLRVNLVASSGGPDGRRLCIA